MSRLVTLNGINDEEVLNSLFSGEISVIEDIQGSKIWVNWNGKEFTIKTASNRRPFNKFIYLCHSLFPCTSDDSSCQISALNYA